MSEWEQAPNLIEESYLPPDKAEQWARDSIDIAASQGISLDAAERHTLPPEAVDPKYSRVQSVMNEFVRSTKSVGYKTAEAWSAGFGGFANRLDHISGWMQHWADKLTGIDPDFNYVAGRPYTQEEIKLESQKFEDEQPKLDEFLKNYGISQGEFFAKAATAFNSDKEYYAQKATEQGPSFIEELFGEALGGAPAGIAEFVLNVPYALASGAAEAKEKGTSQIEGALVEGAQRLMLGKIFDGIASYSKPIRAGVMATVFGGQAAAAGGGKREIAKAVGVGVGYGIAGPKGEIGIRELAATTPEKPLTMPQVARTTAEPTITTPISPEMALIGRTKELSSPDIPLAEKVKSAVSDKYTQAVDAIGRGIDKVKLGGAALFSAVKAGEVFKPRAGGIDGIIGDYTGALQVSAYEARKLAAAIRKQFPDKFKREAIVNYIQSAGDDAKLAEMAGASKGPRKRAYELARRLTDDEKVFADRISQYFDAKLDMAIQSGMLEHGIENYVNQVWAKENPATKGLKSDIAFSRLQPNPSLVKKRIFDTYFEGEQAGYEPKNKDISYLITLYDQSFNRALAARAFIKDLHDMDASDGRPMVAVGGSGKPISSTGETADAYIIRPRSKAEDTQDYRILDHPALRKWKWATKDTIGNPIFLQGDLLVHPEAYDRLKNLLKTSAIRQSRIGRAILTTQATLKGTLLSMSGFHQTQVGIHAIFHKVNPFNAPEIDPSNPLQRALINKGLVVADYKNMELFYEGMAGGGLLTKIPGAGIYLQKYTDYLFTDYIPRIKMAMGVAAHERNTERYAGKLTPDQILSLTADQSNAAFGEQNYAKLGRNPTTQDALRIGFLAPDFFEARARFAGQAVVPYGREQAAALMRGAIGMYVGARIANYVLDGDVHWDKPFSLVVGDDEIQLRSIPGDIYHLMSDPRSFVYHRINPVFVRPIIEAVTGRDQYGHYRIMSEQLVDWITSFIPIPLQGFSDPQKKLWESVLSSLGASAYKSRTSFEKALSEKLRERIIITMSPESRDHYLLVNKYSDQWRDALKEGDKKAIVALKDKILADAKTGKLFKEDVAKIIEYVKHDKVERLAKSATIEDLIDVWDKATDKEKKQYEPVLKEKLLNLREKHPERFKELLPLLRKNLA
jgi:hypothetical protein